MIVYEDRSRKIHQLLLNDYKTNCFLVEKERQVLLIDPVEQYQVILNYLSQNQLQLKFMLATHAHFDHIFAAADLIESGSVPHLYIHEKDFDEVKKSKTFSAMIYKKKFKVPQVKMFDADLLGFLDYLELKIKHAGGHTKGSCYLYDHFLQFIITGDLVLHHKLHINLFDNRENYEEFSHFLDDIQKRFAPETLLFPGHGRMTVLAEEMEKNKKWQYIKEMKK